MNIPEKYFFIERIEKKILSSNAWSRQKRRESLFQRIEGREKGGGWKPLTRVRCTNTNPVKFLFTDRPIWQNEFTLHKNCTPFIIQGLKSTLLPDLIRNFDRSKNFTKTSHLFNLILASKIKNYKKEKNWNWRKFMKSMCEGLKLLVLMIDYPTRIIFHETPPWDNYQIGKQYSKMFTAGDRLACCLLLLHRCLSVIQLDNEHGVRATQAKPSKTAICSQNRSNDSDSQIQKWFVSIFSGV